MLSLNDEKREEEEQISERKTYHSRKSEGSQLWDRMAESSWKLHEQREWRN